MMASVVFTCKNRALLVGEWSWSFFLAFAWWLLPRSSFSEKHFVLIPFLISPCIAFLFRFLCFPSCGGGGCCCCGGGCVCSCPAFVPWFCHGVRRKFLNSSQRTRFASESRAEADACTVCAAVVWFNCYCWWRHLWGWLEGQCDLPHSHLTNLFLFRIFLVFILEDKKIQSELETSYPETPKGSIMFMFIFL